MKISQTEIQAASRFLQNADEYTVRLALHAAYSIRRIRKTAKRERQRKEKDKQVVESVKPAKPFTFWEYSAGDWTKIHVAYDTGEPVVTPSKAPEWDGTFGVGEWEMRNGGKAVVESEDNHDIYPLNVKSFSPWEKSRTKKGQVWETKISPEDLIRPWPKAPLCADVGLEKSP